MGYPLYREIRDYAPSNLSQGELTVALMIADSANDISRRSWIDNELLCFRCRMGVTGVRAALQRLAGRGMEFRVAKSTGKDGRPVYAARGNSVDYLVPTVTQMVAIADTTVSPFPVDNQSDRRHGGVAYLNRKATRESLKGDTRIAKGDTVVSPLSSVTPKPASIPNGDLELTTVENSDDPQGQNPDSQTRKRRHMTALERDAWAAIGATK